MKRVTPLVATRVIKYFMGLMSVWLLCASTALYAVQEDPWEGVNRKVFIFNETIDKYFLKPVARTYSWLAPEFVEKGVSNVFDNLEDVGIMINNVFQIKFYSALNDAGRLLVNSSIGIGGLFDVATRLGLEKNEEDFGQTLGRFHVKKGPYVVLPFFGPSTVRDAFSAIPDSFLKPQRYIDYVPTRNSVYGADIVDTRAGLLDAEKLIQGDKYSFIRDAYLQRRNFLVLDGEIEDDFTSDDLD